jgi:GntR family transcriptional regulator of arabinose operon
MHRTFTDVASELRRRIESGQYPPDQPLPAERSLGDEFGVHRATLRRALARLEEEGTVRRLPGERPYPVAKIRGLEGSIGLYATDEDPFSRSLIASGIVEMLREQGSNLRLVWSDDHAFRPGQPLSPETRSLVGLVLWPPNMTDVARLRELRRAMPTVIVDAPVGGYESDFVGFDDETAGYEAAAHLYEQGHRRIAFVGPLQIETARYRRRGCFRLLREKGHEPVRGFEAFGYVERIPTAVVDCYLGLPESERPTAFLCENDETAALIMPQLVARGLRVPEDVAVMGFGGAQPVILNALGLTTMEQPFAELGRAAARLLLSRIEFGPEAPAREVRLPMKLVERRSSQRIAVSR